MTECAVFVGIPGSGKTTFYRTRLRETHEHVSKDELPPGTDRSRRQLELIAAALQDGRSVAIDNTNPAVSDRAPLIALARAHGARVVAYVFESDTRQSVRRNEQRAGPARVPRVAIFVSAKRLQPPTHDEGFDEIYRVKILDDGAFDVQRA